MAISIADRFRGSLIGLAVCDAVGTAVEFLPPGSFQQLTGMQGGGKFSLLPGQWTDDTSMALCLAESLVECRGYNPVDQSKRYWLWYQENHLSSTGQCFDIGKTTRMALHKFDRSTRNSSGPEPYCGPTGEGAAGNGCMMRLCPVPLCFSRQPQVAMEMSGQSARTTHGATAAIDACRFFGGLIVGCLLGEEKATLLSDCYCPVPSYWDQHPLVPEVEEVARGSYKRKQPPEIVNSGYVVRSMEAALWAFYHTDNFKDGCLQVVNLGNDADTVGAIYGQLAGAYYGASAIPEDWRDKCFFSSLIECLAEELLLLSSLLEPVAASSDWNTQFLPSIDKCSPPYKHIKLCYELLERGNGEIIRRLTPCPKMYKTVEAMDADVKTLEDQFQQLPEEEQRDLRLLRDFRQIWAQGRIELQRRVTRGRV